MASQKHYISSANTYDWKDPKLFQSWINDIVGLATFSGKTQTDIAMSTYRGSLHKYVQDLITSNTPWESMKTKLRERFSECGNSALAKHRLSTLNQDDPPLHRYISKFTGDLAEHTYRINQTQEGSHILASNFCRVLTTHTLELRSDLSVETISMSTSP